MHAASGEFGEFHGSIPSVYERYLVPLIFALYADDLAARVAPLAPARVLELAAGTGVVTRALCRALPAGTTVVATDLSQSMLDEAARAMESTTPGGGAACDVEWRQADAMALPFADGAFDAVACQFGVMFFPDRRAAFAEARRVLRPGGRFVFSTWDALEHNEFPAVVAGAVASLFGEEATSFLARTPHGYHDRDRIVADLRAAGFAPDPQVQRVAHTSRAASPRDVAVGFCQGTPLRLEIERRGPTCLAEATEAATHALARRFGDGPIAGRIQALVVSARR